MVRKSRTKKPKDGVEAPPRDEAYYERVREALDEDAILNRRPGWDEPLSEKYRRDPMVAKRARSKRGE